MYGIRDLDDEEPKREKHVRLEGIPPNKFDGDRSTMHQFLVQFKQFMIMNNEANIAQNLMFKAAYFLLLMDGSKVKG